MDVIQIIPHNPSILRHGDPNTNEMDRRWLHYVDYVINDMAIAPYLDACVEEYMSISILTQNTF